MTDNDVLPFLLLFHIYVIGDEGLFGQVRFESNFPPTTTHIYSVGVFPPVY